MKKRIKPVPEGAPLWVVSYGDMMSLLLTFFIMLASLANFNDVNDKFMAAVQSIRKALGMTGQVGKMVDPSVDFASLINRLESIVKPTMPKNRGDSQERAIQGKTFRQKKIRDGMEITIGGPVLFKPFSATLKPEGKESLAMIAETLKGHRHKIDIRGHAAEQPRPRDWKFQDTMRLSYERAEQVANELIRQGIDMRAITLMAKGANEPIPSDDFDRTQQGNNSRVEIIVRESLFDDYVGQVPASSTPTTQPASQATTQPSSSEPAN